MSRVFIKGVGAVSPAGWGAAALLAAIKQGSSLPISELARPGWTTPLRVRNVPKPATRPAFLAHPRLRRSSPVAHFTLAAATEALGDDAVKVASGTLRLGIVFCVMSGCVQYSRRFFDEVIRDPSTASPLVFPETVFNAPASHLSAFLGSTAENYTLVGDAGTFLHGIEVAGHWLAEGRVDGCLVIGAEELDWLTADAFHHFSRSVVCAEGSGALYLSREPSSVEVDSVTDGVLFTSRFSAEDAARTAMTSLPTSLDNELLVDGVREETRLDRPEINALSGWKGARLSPKALLGEALTASAAWQSIAAWNAIADHIHPAARISVSGPNEQAIAARFKAGSNP
jgi:3-oxoacyl-(acyl-carrier-protein) synthase